MARPSLLFLLLVSVACCAPQTATTVPSASETAFVASVVRAETDRLLLRPTQSRADVWGFVDEDTRIVAHDGTRIAVSEVDPGHSLWLHGVLREGGVDIAEIRRLERP